MHRILIKLCYYWTQVVESPVYRFHDSDPFTIPCKRARLLNSFDIKFFSVVEYSAFRYHEETLLLIYRNLLRDIVSTIKTKISKGSMCLVQSRKGIGVWDAFSFPTICH